MNLTKICLGGLVATLFSLGQANAQMPSDGSVATGGAGYSPPTIPAPGGSTNAHEVASAGTAPRPRTLASPAGCSINARADAADPSAATARSVANSMPEQVSPCRSAVVS